MNNRLCSCQAESVRASSFSKIIACLVAVIFSAPVAIAGDAPPWMHALVSAPLPAHDEKTDAILMYEEINVNVQSPEKIKTQVREVYKILRPSGRDYGIAMVDFNAHAKINGLRGWCIPAQGKDYEVKDKEAIEVALPKVEGSELMSDVRVKLLRIPASDPGNLVGFEYEKEEQPLVLQDVLSFQREIPVRELHYSLQLPAAWEYKAAWVNSPELKPTQTGNQVQWVLSDIKAVRMEEAMPPIKGVAGYLAVSFLPPGGPSLAGFSSWQDMGNWYRNLTTGRRDASAEIKQQVATLTASATTTADKMRAVTSFVQHQIRYVSIQLGIGGFQPHSAADIFAHKYGDCKDKATLLSSMLSQIGVDSYYVVINSERDSVLPQTPANKHAFDHAILAIKLPSNMNDSAFLATIDHPKLGKLLFFDPTNELTPFGQIGGYLQSNYGLLVAPDGGELVALPKELPAMNGVERTAKLNLDSNGNLKGDVTERRLGDRAAAERWRLRTVTKDTDRIKPIEELLSGSLSLFRITKATVSNLTLTEQPFGFNYSFEAANYATNAGGLLLVRPRVLGVKSTALMETKEPRKYPVEFQGLEHDSDTFEITIPTGYEVDDLPSPVDADYGFASYHSKTEAKDNVIRYSRAFEIKELSVPVSRAEELKKFYRIIAGDERNTVVLKATTK